MGGGGGVNVLSDPTPHQADYNFTLFIWNYNKEYFLFLYF